MTQAVEQGSFRERAASGRSVGRLVDSSWRESGQPCLPSLLYTIKTTRRLLSSDLCTEMLNEPDPTSLRALIQRVLDEAPFSMRQLAEEAGISYDAVRSWAADRRTPRLENLEHLAAALERRGSRLHEIADAMRRVTGAN